MLNGCITAKAWELLRHLSQFRIFIVFKKYQNIGNVLITKFILYSSAAMTPGSWVTSSAYWAHMQLILFTVSHRPPAADADNVKWRMCKEIVKETKIHPWKLNGYIIFWMMQGSLPVCWASLNATGPSVIIKNPFRGILGTWIPIMNINGHGHIFHRIIWRDFLKTPRMPIAICHQNSYD